MWKIYVKMDLQDFSLRGRKQVGEEGIIYSHLLVWEIDILPRSSETLLEIVLERSP